LLLVLAPIERGECRDTATAPLQRTVIRDTVSIVAYTPNTFPVEYYGDLEPIPHKFSEVVRTGRT
jgi:hypothetical protein